MWKLLQQAAFVVLVASIGFVGGGALGSLFVPPGSGLAGGATVLLSGLAGTILAAIGAAALALRLPPARFRLTFLGALGLAALIIVWIGVRAAAATA